MADIIDNINTIRLDNVANSNRNMSERLDIEGRARYLEEQHGARVMNWYEFNRANPPPKEKSRFVQMIQTAGIASVIGVVAALGFGAITASTAPFVPVITGAVAMGLMFGLIHDQKPRIQEEQKQRYNGYLDQVEQQLALHKPRSRTVHVDSEAIRSPRPAEGVSATHFQDMVRASREEDELTPTR